MLNTSDKDIKNYCIDKIHSLAELLLNAKGGDVEAQSRLGCAYLYGDGVDSDNVCGLYWLNRAAEKGHAKAQCELGRCYEEGSYATKNLKVAIYWLTKSFAQGNKDAEHQLIVLHSDGHGAMIRMFTSELKKETSNGT